MASVLDLGTLLIRLQADDSQLTRVESRAVQRFEQTTAKLERIGVRMGVAVTAPLTLLGRGLTKTILDFDQSMTKALSIMEGANAKMRKQMEDTARALSRESIYAPQELATAYFHLAQAGLNAKQAMAALPAVAMFATAAMVDMEKATELLITSQSALGLASENPIQNLQNLERVSNVLAKAANMTTASQEGLAVALTSKAAAAARVLGKDVEETVAVLSTFAKVGVTNEMAGERLDIVWRDLGQAFEGHEDQWRQLGLTIYDVSGGIRNTADILQDLHDVLGPMTDRQKVTTLAMLGFQYRSVSAIKQLLGLHDLMRAYEKQLRATGNETKRLADEQMLSMENRLKNLKARYEDAKLTLEQDFREALEVVTEKLRDAIDWFNGLSRAERFAMVTAAALAAATGPLLLVFSAMVSSLMNVGRAIRFAYGGFTGFFILLEKIRLGFEGTFTSWIPTWMSTLGNRTWTAAKSFAGFRDIMDDLGVYVRTTPLLIGTTAFTMQGAAVDATRLGIAFQQTTRNIGTTAFEMQGAAQATSRMGLGFQAVVLNIGTTAAVLGAYEQRLLGASIMTETMSLNMLRLGFDTSRTAMIIDTMRRVVTVSMLGIAGPTLAAAEAVKVFEAEIVYVRNLLTTTAFTMKTTTQALLEFNAMVMYTTKRLSTTAFELHGITSVLPKFAGYLETTAFVILQAATETAKFAGYLETTAFTLVAVQTEAAKFGGFLTVAQTQLAVVASELAAVNTQLILMQTNLARIQGAKLSPVGGIGIGQSPDIIDTTFTKQKNIGYINPTQQVGQFKALGHSVEIVDAQFTKVTQTSSRMSGAASAVSSAWGSVKSTLMSVGGTAAAALGGMFTKAVSAAKTVATAFKFEIFALAVYGIYKMASALYDVVAGTEEFNKALERGKQLTEEISNKKTRGQSRELARITAIADPGQRRSALERQLRIAEADAAGLRSQVRGAERNFDGQGAMKKGVGNKVTGILGDEIGEVKNNLKTAESYVEDLKDALNQSDIQAKQTAASMAEINKPQVQKQWEEMVEGIEKAGDALTDVAKDIELLELKLQGVPEEIAKGWQQIADLQELGAPEEMLRQLDEELQYRYQLNQALEEQERIKEEAEQNLKNMEADARQMVMNVMTPMEKFENEIAKIQTLFNEQLIDRETMERALDAAGKQAAEDIEREDGKQKRKKGQSDNPRANVELVDKTQETALKLRAGDAKGATPEDKMEKHLAEIKELQKKALQLQQKQAPLGNRIQLSPMQVKRFS